MSAKPCGWLKRWSMSVNPVLRSHSAICSGERIAAGAAKALPSQFVRHAGGFASVLQMKHPLALKCLYASRMTARTASSRLRCGNKPMANAMSGS